MMDNSQALQQKVQEAFESQQPLSIKGSGSKAFYGYPHQDEELNTSSHTGIVNYEATELVLSARAGTPLKEIETALAENGQMLGCEAPHFGENSSFGGMIAAGLSGPRRPFGGSISDLILGCTILNGKGEILKFGGRVMKNVAGYDNSRLMVGSLGCLGLILDATVKVVPKPKAERSFRFAIAQDRLTAFINNLTHKGFPVSASCQHDKHLVLRFSAGEQEISKLDSSLQQHVGAMDFEEELMTSYWHNLREQRSSFFAGDADIWRISLAPNTAKLELSGDTLIEWNGALRWLKTNSSDQTIFKKVASKNGSATLFRQGKFRTGKPEMAESIFQPLSPALMNWHRQLKKAFDPAGIFNPGRMYRDL